MKSNLRNGFLAAAVSLALASPAQAVFVNPNLGSNTSFDGWNNLTITNPQIAEVNANAGGQGAPGAFGAFPGANPWPEAIESHVPPPGTVNPIIPPMPAPQVPYSTTYGDATFDKVSGLGYPAGISIYASPFGNGTYNVSDDNPLAGVQTITFQLEIGTGSDPRWLSAFPTLNVNGGTFVPIEYFKVLSQGIGNTGFGPVNVGVLAYQWDVSGLGQIDSIDIEFTPAGTSTTILGMQLDQGDQFSSVILVPEPTSAALLGLAALGLMARRRRKS
ncbi:MAG: PEP-CTERM sorting domain-containing protein [Verrucomicrobiota bacterium]